MELYFFSLNLNLKIQYDNISQDSDFLVKKLFKHKP